MVSSASSNKNFDQQVPKGNIWLFPYFRGRVRDFALFETGKDIPYSTPVGGTWETHEEIASKDLVIYGNMKEMYFDDSKNGKLNVTIGTEM